MRDRKAALLLGHDAEYWAALLLMMKGYRIRERRLLTGGGEVDLVVSRGKTLVFVEVKARRTLDEALVSISPEKLRRIARAARSYLGRLPYLPDTIRCDAVLVAPGRFPRHIVAVGELPLD